MEIQTPLVLFTLFLCLTCGLMGFQGILFLQGKGSRKFHLTTIVVTAVALVVGGIAVFTHLKHWERIFNGFGHITSGITHELILVVVIVIALIAAFLAVRKSEDGEFAGRAWGIVFIIIALVGGFVTAHSYDMYARPAWSNVYLYLYYYASLLVLGAAGIWTIAAACKESEDVCRPAALWTLISAVLVAALSVLAMHFIATIDPTTIEGITFYTYDPLHPAVDPAADLAACWSGSSALLFWLGAVCAGGILPALIAAIAYAKKALAANVGLAALALVCAIAGGVCYRVCLYIVGIASYVYFF